MKILRVRVAATKRRALLEELSERFALTPAHDVSLTPGEHELTFLLGPEHDEEQIEVTLGGMLSSHQILNVVIEDHIETGEEDEKEGNGGVGAPYNLSAEEEGAFVNKACVYAEFGNASRAEILAALQEYRERRRMRPCSRLLSRQETVAAVGKGEYVEGVVAIDLGDLIDLELEGFLDKLSQLLTGGELLMDIQYEVVGHEKDSLWMKISGNAKEVVETEEFRCYVEEVVIYTRQEAQTIREASRIGPWEDWEAVRNPEAVYLLPVRIEGVWEDGVVVPPTVRGTHRLGLRIEGQLSKETLQSLSDVLDGQRLWLAWSESDLLLVIPDPNTRYPMEDPLLAGVGQALAVEIIPPELSDFGLTFIDRYKGYLIVRTRGGECESWPMLPDGRGIDQDLIGEGQVLEYQGDLYHYGATYATQAEIYPLVDRELGK